MRPSEIIEKHCFHVISSGIIEKHYVFMLFHPKSLKNIAFS